MSETTWALFAILLGAALPYLAVLVGPAVFQAIREALMAAWVTTLRALPRGRTTRSKSLPPAALAALEAEAFEEVYPEKTVDLIARLDRELNPPKPRSGAQVGLAPAEWWPEGGRNNLPPRGFGGEREIVAQGPGGVVTIATRNGDVDVYEIRDVLGRVVQRVRA